MDTASRPPAIATTVPPDVGDLTTPVVVVCGPHLRDAIDRAARIASAGGVPLHLVTSSARPMSPWALLLGARPGTTTAQSHRWAEDLARDLRGRGLHVEIHTTTRRPHHLAAAIASTIGGRVVT